MTSLALRLARPEIVALEPFDIAACNAGATPDAIKLDANENPYPPLVEGALAASVNRYPEPQPQRLRSSLAALYGVASENLVVTRGADDAIDMLMRTFCRPAIDAVAVCTPSFSAYAHFVKLQGARLIEVPLTGDFDFDAEAFIEALSGDANLKLAFICTPNNPTGNQVDPALILRVADALPETIIVADEAYLDFAQTPSLAARGDEAGEPRRAEDALQGLRPRRRPRRLRDRRAGADRRRSAGAAALPDAEPIGGCGAGGARALAPRRSMGNGSSASRRIASGSRRFWRARRSSSRVRPSGGNFLFLEVEDPYGFGSGCARSAYACASAPMPRPAVCA